MKKYSHNVRQKIRVFGNSKSDGGYEDLHLYVDVFYLKPEIKKSIFPKLIFRITELSYGLVSIDDIFGYDLVQKQQRTYWSFGAGNCFKSLRDLLKIENEIYVSPSTMEHILNNPVIQNTIFQCFIRNI